MRAELTAATSSQQNAGVLQPYRVEIDSGAYASGVIRLTWPDGDWDIKLPDARVLTLSVRAGRTSDLAIFIWNTLIPGSGFTLHPPSGSVLTVFDRSTDRGPLAHGRRSNVTFNAPLSRDVD